MKVIALAGCLALAGCGVANHIEASSNYRQSETSYRSCLLSNSAAPEKCEALRLAMEADERRYNNTGAALDGIQSSHSVTILNR